MNSLPATGVLTRHVPSANLQRSRPSFGSCEVLGGVPRPGARAAEAEMRGGVSCDSESVVEGIQDGQVLWIALVCIFYVWHESNQGWPPPLCDVELA